MDTYGIPVLRISMTFRENEHAMIDDMARTATEMLEAAGGKNVTVLRGPRPRARAWGSTRWAWPAWARAPSKSVLNAFQQSHDVENLFVMDGSGFTSSACQNPTLTIMALAVRSCDYLMDEMRKGNL